MTEEQTKMFISQIAPLIQAEAKKRGYLYPSAIIAQACLESAYGASLLGYKYHNYFGMKCGSKWGGKSVDLNTKEEYTPGNLTNITARFRVYNSMEEGVAGYFDFISSSRYENLKTATSPKNYLELIKADGYATSSTYVNNTYAVITRHNLTQYDNILQTKEVDPDIVAKILKGEIGNGAQRYATLTQLGYNPNEVQKKVNEVVTISGTVKELKKELGEYWSCAELLI